MRGKSFYKRVDHLNEKLSQLLGRQSVDAPEEVVQAVASCMAEAGENMASLTGLTVRAYLKKLKLGKYYEQCYSIANRLSRNASVVRLDHRLEEDLRRWFLKIQAPFEKHKGPSRKSFLNYSYVLYQLLSLVPEGGGEVAYLKSQLTMLKSKVRLRAADQVWALICNDVGLEFKPYITDRQGQTASKKLPKAVTVDKAAATRKVQQAAGGKRKRGE